MIKPLASCVSQCESRQPIIVCTGNTNRSEYRALNNKRALVKQYQIDGDVIKGNECKKCDWLILNEDKMSAYFIELKGGHIEKGIDQIDCSVKNYKTQVQNYQIFARIIGKSTTHSIYTKKMRTWIEHPYTTRGNNRLISKHSFEESI